MRFFIIGLNHKTASVDVREKIVFSSKTVVPAVRCLLRYDEVNEAMILSTCNRTEIYVYGTICSDDVLLWLMQFHRLENSLPSKLFYVYEKEKALHHAIRVASGLDSMIKGEPQILGQFKSSYSASCIAQALSGPLDKMLQYTFKIAKKIRTETGIGHNPMSVASSAVVLAQHIFSDLKTKTALLIGAGKTIELVYQHLRKHNIQQVIIASRNQNKGLQLASSDKGVQSIILGDVKQCLHKADIVIASTASQVPLLGKGAVENALKKRKYRPMLMIDIAVPRDIEPEVIDLPGVYLYTVDDLYSVIRESIENREKEAKIAEQIVNESVNEFIFMTRERSAVNALKHYRYQAEVSRDKELEKALRLLSQGKNADQVLCQLAHNLTNKLIHPPCMAIRKAYGRGETSKMNWVKEVLSLSEQGSSDHYEEIYN